MQYYITTNCWQWETHEARGSVTSWSHGERFTCHLTHNLALKRVLHACPHTRIGTIPRATLLNYTNLGSNGGRRPSKSNHYEALKLYGLAATANEKHRKGVLCLNRRGCPYDWQGPPCHFESDHAHHYATTSILLPYASGCLQCVS